MTAHAIFLWLMLSASHADGHGHEIPRQSFAANTIAIVVAAETDAPQVYAAMLDVLAAHESAYHTGVTGDGGRSCGAYQTPCARTPPDGLGQTRLAARLLKQANEHCAGHPLWLYARGECKPSAIALRYEREVKAMLSAKEEP
jgi:hypothetical protein